MESIQNSEKERLQASVACLLAWLPDTDKKVFRVKLLKTVLSFLTNQAT